MHCFQLFSWCFQPFSEHLRLLIQALDLCMPVRRHDHGYHFGFFGAWVNDDSFQRWLEVMPLISDYYYLHHLRNRPLLQLPNPILHQIHRLGRMQLTQLHY